MNCPCGTENNFSECCEPYLKGKKFPPTAEKLMRSRYTAYVYADIDYLKNTLAPESRTDFDPVSTKDWAKQAKWKKLKILSTENGQENDKKGTVEFIATYDHKGEGIDHHEISKFRKSDNGHWLFIEGDAHTHKEGEDHNHAKPQTIVREQAKIGRNDPCSCGSGKIFKKCCGLNS